MSGSGCHEFRDALELRLRGRSLPERLAPLSFDGHLATCPDCRELLEAEEALEVLLASLPDPVLPPELSARVLARLSRSLAEADLRLDALLDREPSPSVPADLAGRVLAGLERDRVPLSSGEIGVSSGEIGGPSGETGGLTGEDARLDSLLGLLPAPEVPSDLAGRTLAALRSERVAPRRAHLALLRDRRVLTAAALLLATLSGVALWRALRPPQGGGSEGGPVARIEEVPEELLANLGLFADDWELLMAEDLDAFLGTLPEEDRLWLSAADGEEPDAEEPGEGDAVPGPADEDEEG